MNTEPTTTDERTGEGPGFLRSPRRGFLTRALGLGAGAFGLAAAGRTARGVVAATVNDVAILNFALNFDYVGAEYYTLGLTGSGIAAAGVPITGAGTPGPTTVKASPKVTFDTSMVEELVAELARDEQRHVKFLRSTLALLGAPPIAKPAIDLLNSFNLAARLAGLGSTFDPFANETNFLLGAYLLEETEVTALHGAAPLIRNKDVLNGSAGLLGIEAYHSGAIRTLLFQRGQGAQTQALSTLRANASGVADYGVAQGPLGMGPAGAASLVLADANAIAFARSFRQVLNIAYLSPGAAAGGFFPAGVNGTIRS